MRENGGMSIIQTTASLEQDAKKAARINELENAIRGHRSSRSPRSWSDADRRLYGVLDEVRQARTT